MTADLTLFTADTFFLLAKLFIKNLGIGMVFVITKKLNEALNVKRDDIAISKKSMT